MGWSVLAGLFGADNDRSRSFTIITPSAALSRTAENPARQDEAYLPQ